MKVSRVFRILIVIFILTLFIRVYRIDDISMNYSLFDGDIVIVDNFSIGIHIPSYFFYIDEHIWKSESGIKRGDILVFRHPLDRRLYIKRCVALPKDTVFQKSKNLYLQIESNSSKTFKYAKKYNLQLTSIDGKWWLKNPYMRYYPIVHDSKVVGPKMLIDYPITKIAPHNYFFMGDFRDNSTDSRFFDAIPYRYIYYKMRYLIQPLRNIEDLGSISHYK